MSKYTRGLLAVILAVVLVLPAAAFAMLPEANARSSTGMDGPTVSGTVVDPDTSGRWEIWAAGHNGNKVTTQNVGRIWTDKTVKKAGENEASDFVTTLSAMSSTSNSTVTVTTPLDIVMVLDGAGWHKSPFQLADNLRLIFLPPYAPELNPQEHVWDELREKYFHNRAFDSLEALEAHLEQGLAQLENQPGKMQSLTGWEWIINSISN